MKFDNPVFLAWSAAHFHDDNNNTHSLVDFGQPPPKGARRQAAECDVRAEDRGARAQRVGRCLRFLKAAHPSLKVTHQQVSEY